MPPTLISVEVTPVRSPLSAAVAGMARPATSTATAMTAVATRVRTRMADIPLVAVRGRHNLTNPDTDVSATGRPPGAAGFRCQA